MVGIGAPERAASSTLHARLMTTRVGRRWERLFRAHSPEIAALLAVHPDLRRDVSAALSLLAWSDPARPLSASTRASVASVLDDLHRLGGTELQRAAENMTEELLLARGRSLDEVLGAA